MQLIRYFGKRLVTLILSVIAFSPFALADAASLVLEQAYTSIENGWEKVERWVDNSALFHSEDYPLDGRGNQDGQRLFFFNNVLQPHSSRFLLYYGEGNDTNPVDTPVLLVHGANDNVDRAWANPNESGSYGCGSLTCPSAGAMQYLVGLGYRIFAINFPHKQGDNRYWAEQVHDAISIIRENLGVTNVDVIGWSKGAFAARMYASSVKHPGGTDYADDIRKLILIGNPNEGFDYIFRHGWYHDFTIFTECGGSINAPAPHTKIVCYGFWRHHPELSIYSTSAGNFFPGQGQMLARWDSLYPLPAAEQDWYTTYHGGWGLFTYGFGIQVAIDQSSLVQDILDAGIPASIDTYLLSGNYNIIPGIHYEHTGPSDGVLFIDGAASEQSIGNTAGNVTVYLNHLQLGWGTLALHQINSWLQE